MNGQRKLGFGLGVAIGATIGAGLALLLSPARGQETRQGLSNWGRDLGARSWEGTQGVLARSRDALARSRERLASETEKWRERHHADEPQVKEASGEEATLAAETRAQTS